MKKIIIAIISILFHSCDPTTCCKYIIENKTDKNLKLVKFSSDSLGIRSMVTDIFANDSHVEADRCSLGTGCVIYYYEDSIQIKANDILLKTYYPDDRGKSIFKTSPVIYGKEAINSWKLIDNKSDYEKNIFEITEEDLK